MTNASDSFFGSGESLSYPLGANHLIGRVRGGRIVTEPKEVAQTDINTKATLYWDDAKTRPMTQLMFTVVCDGSGHAAANGWATDERVDAQDQGMRVMYIKGKDLTEAVGKELKRHHRPGLRVGDEIYNVWTGERPGKNGVGKARTWASMLFPGTEAVPSQEQFFQGNQPQPQAPQMPQGFGAPAPQAPQGFGAQNGGQVPMSQPVTGQYLPPNGQGFPSGPAGPAQQPAGPPPQFGAPAPQQPAQQTAYGFGHNPAGSPGQQAHAAAQGFGSPQGPTGEFHTQAHGFGVPQPQFEAPAQPGVPSANPWGQPAQPEQPQAQGQQNLWG